MPIQQRIEEARAAEAKLKTDLDGLEALREPGKAQSVSLSHLSQDEAENAALDAWSLALASLQALGIPGKALVACTSLPSCFELYG